ncbi:phosphate/phosphite/phosphonate ABC transporter substrate-binding protein [Ktedonobacter racemifer]|uniref:Transcriptional regulator, LacI family n=1 Tax=Ktedonobacter racemifer DSM 44963 TaxID=485913 RepID=D6TBN0_KTERA|nr:phosphate/phosphite/phosphonate ABC transporter substrate-binding protein [Ktedonobacter racemifer]EFH89812.1 transcriptional regulator, LacI family [Ktedonobacter racemifer DSM 44963]
MKQEERRAKSPFVFATDPGLERGSGDLQATMLRLEQYLGRYLQQEVQVMLSQNYEEILTGLEEGTIDGAKLGPYAFALAQARLGVKPLANPIEIPSAKGELPPPYRSLIFTRADSGITHLAQLKGKSFGFVGPHSTSGYLVATFLLQQAGIDANVDLQPRFLHSHQVVAQAVLRGEVAGGAMMETEWIRLAQKEHSLPLRRLATSPLLSRGPVVIRQGLPTQVERGLLAALEQLHQSQEAFKELLLFPGHRYTAAVHREHTLKTIADLAGVSYATVSRAINGRDRISSTTTARILRLVEELGYRPNINARSLHKGRSDLIAMLLPTLEYPQINEIVAGIQSQLHEAQMHLLVCPIGLLDTHERVMQQNAYLHMLTSGRFDGSILTQWSALDSLALDNVIRSGNPYVIFEQDILSEGLQVVYDWLREQGSRKIALIIGPTTWLEPATLQRFGAQFPDICVYQLTDMEQCTNLIERLQSSLEPPNAFFCSDDQTAWHIRRSLKVSTEMPLLVSCGRTSLARLSGWPSLTFNGSTLGRVVAGRLLRMLNKPMSPCEEHVTFHVETSTIS